MANSQGTSDIKFLPDKADTRAMAAVGSRRNDRRRASDDWVARWLSACADLAELERSNPMTDAVIDEIDGRMIRIGDKLARRLRLLQLPRVRPRPRDHRPDPGLPREVGHTSRAGHGCSEALSSTSRSRSASPPVRAPDTLVFPTITLIHLSVIPLLAASGRVFVDRRAHKTIYEGAELATLRGATLKRFEHDYLDELESLLRSDSSSARLICIDGVNSMTGNVAEHLRVRRARARARRDPLRRRRSRVRRDRRAKRRRAVAVRTPRQQRRPLLRRDVRERRARRGLVEGVLVTRRVHRVPARDEATAQDGRAAVPVFGPVAGRVARDDDWRARGQRPPRRRDSRRPLAEDARVLDRLDQLGVHTPNQTDCRSSRCRSARPRADR